MLSKQIFGILAKNFALIVYAVGACTFAWLVTSNNALRSELSELEEQITNQGAALAGFEFRQQAILNTFESYKRQLEEDEEKAAKIEEVISDAEDAPASDLIRDYVDSLR